MARLDIAEFRVFMFQQPGSPEVQVTIKEKKNPPPEPLATILRDFLKDSIDRYQLNPILQLSQMSKKQKRILKDTLFDCVLDYFSQEGIHSEACANYVVLSAANVLGPRRALAELSDVDCTLALHWEPRRVPKKALWDRFKRRKKSRWT